MVVSCVETTHNDLRLAVETLSGGIISGVANYIRREFKIMRVGNTNSAFLLTTTWRRNWRRGETGFGKRQREEELALQGKQRKNGEKGRPQLVACCVVAAGHRR